MNRELLVTLIRKNIDELIMLTEGFMEMNTYPAAIINLAKNKTDDIWSYINQLGNLKPEEIQALKESLPTTPEQVISEIKEEIVVTEEQTETETDVPGMPEIVPANEVKIQESDLVEEEEEDDLAEEEEYEEYDENEEEEEEVPEEDTETEIKVEFTDVLVNKLTEKDTTEKIITTTETTEKKITIGEKISGNGMSRNELHSRTENGGINAAIGNKKIEDIRQAISLGDRFRFQRELFKNNGEEMNKVLSYINKLATYEEVLSFLQSKYSWDNDNAVAEDFYQIIKRKF